MANLIRVGILMGGASREREISFAGGRTVFDNLDKALFEPIPIFVDSFNRLVELRWEYLYKGTIRDFFPPKRLYPEHSPYQYYIEQLPNLTDDDYEATLRELGTPLHPHELAKRIDLAFLTLHGSFGEDGSIQGLLEWHQIPYTGSGVLGSAVGIDKIQVRQLMETAGFPVPKWKQLWLSNYDGMGLQLLLNNAVAESIRQEVGLPCVLKNPTQGSSIGVAIVPEIEQTFTGEKLTDAGVWGQALEKCALTRLIDCRAFRQLPLPEQQQWVARLMDIREGLGLPVISINEYAPGYFRHINSPEELLQHLLEYESEWPLCLLAHDAPRSLLVEEFIPGTEFSVIVVENENGQPVALPPTGIVKQQPVFDYRAKYLPGIVRKQTPIDLPLNQVQHICQEAERLYTALNFDVYARIDGILHPNGTVYFNDPNTTSGMLPGSFFFHQAAEVGLAPRQFLTFIVLKSLQRRTGLRAYQLEHRLLNALRSATNPRQHAQPIGVVFGGWSSERHISVESGRNVFEKFNSSVEYAPAPLFLLHNQKLTSEQRARLGLEHSEFSFWELPIGYVLKDNADDIAEEIVRSIDHPTEPELLQKIALRLSYDLALVGVQYLQHPVHVPLADLKTRFAALFLALHGRPGEDGTVQRTLHELGMVYNGSAPYSAALTIDKYATNQRLRENGLLVADHRLVAKAEYEASPTGVLNELEQQFGYPLILKPQDDGCSSAVQKVDDRPTLEAYFRALLRPEGTDVEPACASTLNLKPREEFPAKLTVLVERLIAPPPGWRQLEVTVGFLTHTDPDGTRTYEVLEPSEAVASGRVLSLEEKFLAGEGQNITPAFFHAQPTEQLRIRQVVQQAIGRAAQLVDAEGYGRIDAFVQLALAPSTDVRVYIIEVNSLPGLTPATCIFHQAAVHGYTPYRFLAGILQEGRHRSKPTSPALN